MHLYECEAFDQKTSWRRKTSRIENQLQESKRLIEHGHDFSLVLNYSMLKKI